MSYRHIAFYSAGRIRNDPRGSVICGERTDPIPGRVTGARGNELLRRYAVT